MKAVFDGRVSIETIYLADGETGRLYDRLLFESDFDHVHFLWREPLFRLFYDRHYLNEVVNGLAKPGEERSSVISRLASKLGEVTITFAVYDHLHLSPEDIETRRACVAFLDGYTVSSAILGEAYASHYGIGATAETPDGVNRKLFTPKNLERFSELERPLVVGWAGNSEWEKGSGDDPKGFETILKPALALLASEGLSVVGHFADRKERWRPIDEMPGYYAEIDVLVCASRSEGTPNPVLEAMSCGVPIVSTVVGIVPEVFGRRQREFLVGREVGALADALRRLYRDRQLLRVLSNENLVQIDSWNWIDHATKWLHLFETARNIRFGGRGILRAKYFENIAATHALHVQVDQLAAHVASLRKSLSWRITAPLRAIRRLY
jgi:glycosyltransferase involved in cell wall biosynthesis